MTSAANRASIEKHGLDWRQMGATHGIAGGAGASLRPEVPGIFLVDDEFDYEWFAHMGLGAGHESLDVWAVTLPEGAQLVESLEGFEYFPEPIPPEAIRLHVADWTTRRPSDVAGDLLVGARGSDLLSEKAVAVDVDGNRHEGTEAVREWLRALQERRGNCGAEMQGIDKRTTLVSPAGRAPWILVRVDENRVTELREFRSGEGARRFASPGD